MRPTRRSCSPSRKAPPPSSLYHWWPASHEAFRTRVPCPWSGQGSRRSWNVAEMILIGLEMLCHNSTPTRCSTKNAFEKYCLTLLISISRDLKVSSSRKQEGLCAKRKGFVASLILRRKVSKLSSNSWPTVLNFLATVKTTSWNLCFSPSWRPRKNNKINLAVYFIDGDFKQNLGAIGIFNRWSGF